MIKTIYWIAAVYGTFAASALAGNIWVTFLLSRQLYAALRHSCACGVRRNVVHPSPCLLNLLVLSIADIVAAIALIFFIFDITEADSFLNDHLCKLYWFCEGFHRFLDPYLLLTLAVDRYCGVCRPGEPRWRQPCTVIAVLFVSCLVPAAFILVALFFSGLARGVLDANTLHIRAACMLAMEPRNARRLFFLSQLVLIYLAPMLAIAALYTLVIRTLWKRSAPARQISHVPLKRVTLTAVGLVLFHFVCWTPYWLGSLYFKLTTDQTANNSYPLLWIHNPSAASFADGYWQSSMVHLIQAVSFLQPATNWFLYVYMNKQLHLGGDRLGGLPTAFMNRLRQFLVSSEIAAPMEVLELIELAPALVSEQPMGRLYSDNEVNRILRRVRRRCSEEIDVGPAHPLLSRHSF